MLAADAEQVSVGCERALAPAVTFGSAWTRLAQPRQRSPGGGLATAALVMNIRLAACRAERDVLSANVAGETGQVDGFNGSARWRSGGAQLRALG